MISVLTRTCESCGSAVTTYSADEGTNSYSLVNQQLDGTKRDIPFRCSLCGAIQLLHNGSKFHVTRDVVFIYTDPVAEKIGSIYVPDSYKEAHKTSVGTVLAIGPGYHDRKKGRFVPTELKVGDRVAYDKNIPWAKLFKDPQGVEHEVVYCGEQDVKLIIEEG